MKVYIVTSGSYSDYGIHKVFLDKAKAKHYTKCHDFWGDEPNIEEYDTYDDNIDITDNGYIEATISWDINLNDFSYTQTYCNTEKNEIKEDVDKNYWYISVVNSYMITLNIERWYKRDNLTEEQAKVKVEKIMQDLYAKLKYAVAENNGVLTEDILNLYFKKL